MNNINKDNENNCVDLLTGLKNMKFFEEAYNSYIGTDAYVVAIDFRNLKYINDKFGHLYGDEALKIFSRYLELSFPESVLIRRSGDEFFVLTSDQKNTVISKIESIANSITSLNREGKIPYSFSFNSGLIKVGPSFKETIEAADLTMYEAKKHEQLITEYEDNIVVKHKEKLEFIKNIDYAIDNNDFNVVYEKLDDVDIYDSKVVDDDNVPIFNQDTINVLAKNYKIEKVDLVTSKHIINSINDSIRSYIININHRTLFSKDFDYIKEINNELAIRGIDSNRICINIDTTGYTGKTTLITNKINLLKSIGVKTSIGDVNVDSQQLFTHILTLSNIDYVKIDYEVFEDMYKDKRLYNVIRYMNELLKELEVTPIIVNVNETVDIEDININALVRKKTRIN